ncbi:MAG: ABC transporter permease [Planctomycetes bacterium]|nr:ABC transporter permease [Planctomycetota bacterium]
MAIPLTYNLRSVFVRKGATVLTVTAIAFAVAVLVLVLALARGFEEALAGTGSDANAILLRSGATSEGVSSLTRDQARILAVDEFVMRDQDGEPLAQAEVYAAFSIERSDGGRTNIPVRGTGPRGLALREGLRLAEGRMFVPGRFELVAGQALVGRVPGLVVGGDVELSGYTWRVAGILDAQGQAYDSELWIDVEVFLRVIDRPAFSTMIVRLAEPQRLAAIDAELSADPRLTVQAKSERQYFAEQAGALSIVLKALAWFLAAIMGTGAVFGATNTLLASVAMRTHEIGTLLAIGFSPRAVFLGFLSEAVVLALLGGVLGVVLGWQCNGLATGTTNWTTFTEQSFAFRVTGDVVVQALVLALLIGVVGGALPARRASRLPPSAALRTL